MGAIFLIDFFFANSRKKRGQRIFRKISDEEFKDKKCKYFDEDKVSIRDKEQLFYYKIYRSGIGIASCKHSLR